jgi:hypothetical protein
MQMMDGSLGSRITHGWIPLEPDGFTFGGSWAQFKTGPQGPVFHLWRSIKLKRLASFAFKLPTEDQIEVMQEVRTLAHPGLIKKTIRYKNGIVAVLFQDFQNHVFSIHLRSDRLPFLITANGILKVD